MLQYHERWGVYRNRIDTKQNGALDIAVNVIEVQVAPGANTLRSPGFRYTLIFILKRKGAVSIFKIIYFTPFWALNSGPVASQ